MMRVRARALPIPGLVRRGKVDALYQIWRHIRARCEDASHPGYEHYGARGVSVCEPWKDFVQFMRDVGARPKGMTLVRIDNRGDYAPGNVQWVTRKELHARVQKAAGHELWQNRPQTGRRGGAQRSASPT